MSLIRWKPEYSVGVPDVDHEHQELIREINQLHGQLEENDRGSVAEALGQIYNLVAAHFALEERVMQMNDYPGYEAHKEDHERLLDEIADLMDEAEMGGEYDPEELSRRLDAWFGKHFSTFDARLHGRLRGHG
ncbi:MAG: hemerythrin-like metal-binding protein [Gammaproteobacteria bacterium]|nr:MAG: hemerythrin-like metal-binding protein [Gammaproteobacteria bacterium]